MKLPLKSVAWLLPLLLTGCIFHKTQPTSAPTLAPPIADAPPPRPEPSPTDLPPPVVSVPDQPPAPIPSTQTQPTPKPPVKHKKPTPASAPPPPANNTEVAANGNPGVSAIGQLSSGDPADLRQQTINSIASIEHDLNGIGRKLSDPEQKTAAHIREFLKQAKAALNSGDVDGAQTLAVKAKVLLEELSR